LPNNRKDQRKKGLEKGLERFQNRFQRFRKLDFCFKMIYKGLQISKL
jgi:hypothetical protein